MKHEKQLDNVIEELFSYFRNTGGSLTTNTKQAFKKILKKFLDDKPCINRKEILKKINWIKIQHHPICPNGIIIKNYLFRFDNSKECIKIQSKPPAVPAEDVSYIIVDDWNSLKIGDWFVKESNFNILFCKISNFDNFHLELNFTPEFSFKRFNYLPDGCILKII
jgi:hypothetical protein